MLDLWIVSPRCNPISDEALKVCFDHSLCENSNNRQNFESATRAEPQDYTVHVCQVSCGSSVMGSLQVADSLAAALADTVSSIGFTRRAGGARVTHASLRRLLMSYPAVLPLAAQQQQGIDAGATALIFGCENQCCEDPRDLSRWAT